MSWTSLKSFWYWDKITELYASIPSFYVLLAAFGALTFYDERKRHGALRQAFALSAFRPLTRAQTTDIPPAIRRKKVSAPNARSNT